MNTLYANDLVNPNQYIDFDTLAILSKISSDGFLLKYRVIGDENSFRVQSLNGGKNYTNDLGTDLRRALLEIGFYYIPQKVQTLIPSETNAFNITRDDFAKSVVDKISDKNLIFPLIRNCSSAVVEHYINSLSTISIDHKISDSDIRWQIIKFAVSRDNEDNDFYCFMTYTNSKFYTEQCEGMWRVLCIKLKKIRAIIRNKDFHYTETFLTKAEFDEFKEYINSIE
jgi:hypothetical protein